MFIFREEQYRDADGQPNQEAEGHRGDHHRQAAQRPDRHGEAGVHQGAHAVRESGERRAVTASSWKHGSWSFRYHVQVIRPTVARVDLEAIRSNLRRHLRLPRCIGHSCRLAIIAVVKANAYGHGAPEVGLALEDAGAAMLACADIEEGIVLREAGVRAPILIFGALSVSDLDGVFTHHLTPTISTPSAARALQQAAARRQVTLRCHLKIDTGMNRLGFRHDNLDRTLPEVAASPNLAIDAVYTHFATADAPDHPAFAEQRLRFDAACVRLPSLGIPIHVAPRRQQRGAAARRAGLVRLRPAGAAPLWHRAAATRLDAAAATCPVTAQSYRCGEGPAARRRNRVRVARGRRPGPDRGRRSRRLCRRPGSAARQAAGACSCAAAARPSSAPCAWTCR